MIIPKDIQEQTINFCVSPALASQESRVRTQIAHLVSALNLIPLRHLMLLREVPVVIWKLPDGEHGTGGWVAPTLGRRGEEELRNVLYDAWLTGRRGARFGVQGELSTLAHSNGIIHMTDVALFRTAMACQLTILHETGHCVDYHLDLNSTPSDGDDSYRNGNRPYQGQLYRNTGYNNHEFKAETYSRLFIRPNALCRRGRASPPCVNSANHSRCNHRIRRDLANSPAFRSAGTDALVRLGLASISSESAGQLALTRGPAGMVLLTAPSDSQLAPHASERKPGPIGVA